MSGYYDNYTEYLDGLSAAISAETNYLVDQPFQPFGNFTPINNTATTPPTGFCPDYIFIDEVKQPNGISAIYLQGNIEHNINFYSFDNDPSVKFFDFSSLINVTSPITLSASLSAFYISTISANQISVNLSDTLYIENPNAFFTLWKNRTGIVYSKMRNIWNSMINTATALPSKGSDFKFTAAELARVISAQTKLQNIDYAIITDKNTITNFPYDNGKVGTTVINESYNIANIIGSNTKAAIASTFLNCITGDVEQLFPF